MGESRWYIRLGNLGFNLIMLNIMWVICSFVGLVVFGFFPATVALFAVIRKIILEDEAGSIYLLFIQQFKAEFIKSNILGYLIVFIAVFLYVDLKVIEQLNNTGFQVVLFNGLFVISVFFAISVLYVFPLYVHFNLKLVQYLQYACILTIAKPFHTIMLIGSLGVILFIYWVVPALSLLLGFSLFCFIVMKISSLSLSKNQNAVNKT
ncbi:DUF624 domain-containing protein [Gracilibacillus sp. S3-1-1]|uniref:DUF624 domain-containing protein n=1 Tax=Gracilibacillus pellucidus TaxID=3095368 RepID=A0ACC6M3Q0_9BACI|nr:DUF624 domain-containing protein [Gracilibacillus sp. S3-1-1]MDX8045528.1 DUF624 domain-containing protein [Gracilibacillus sp. S3-1-1]